MTDGPTSEPNEVLADRYELGAIIGHGAMGTVRVGRDRILDRVVAIKLLHAHLADDTEVRARFEQEARLAAQLHHPNAVAIFDTGEHAGTPFIVMEHVEGETLATRIAREPLAATDARAIGAELLDALAAAHALGIVHRDVKPSNILLTTDNRAKLADFGIAKSAETSDRTSVGLVVGTLAYLAPERLRGAPATAQSDLYAVGAVLYEAVTGQKPFAATTPVARLEEIRRGATPDPRAIEPAVDGALAATIRRALATQPAQRFMTAQTMRSALTPDTGTEVMAVATPMPLLAPHRRAVATRVAWGVAAVLVIAGLMAARADDGTPPLSEVTVDRTPTTGVDPATVVAAREASTTTASSAPTTTTEAPKPKKDEKDKGNDENDDD